MDNNFLFLCALQVTLVYEKYSALCLGKYNDIYFYMKITFSHKITRTQGVTL